MASQLAVIQESLKSRWFWREKERSSLEIAVGSVIGPYVYMGVPMEWIQ